MSSRHLILKNLTDLREAYNTTTSEYQMPTFPCLSFSVACRWYSMSSRQSAAILNGCQASDLRVSMLMRLSPSEYVLRRAVWVQFHRERQAFCSRVQ